MRHQLFTATLTPEPGVTTSGTATGVLLLNTATGQVGAVISYQELTGTPTAVHLHGPGPGGEVTFEFTGIPSGATGLVASAFQLTPAQVVDLQAGRDSFEVHTPSFPDGELSGTLTHRE
jgi:CHRD domain